MFMRETSWRIVDPTIKNPLVLGEPKDIVQRQIISLTTIGLNVRLEVYVWIVDCTDPHVAWVRLQTQYQFINNATCLMLKDKLNNLCLHEGRFDTKYFRQIQETQLELQGINQHAPKVHVVEWCSTFYLQVMK
jgi:hypothetical protein